MPHDAAIRCVAFLCSMRRTYNPGITSFAGRTEAQDVAGANDNASLVPAVLYLCEQRFAALKSADGQRVLGSRRARCLTGDRRGLVPAGSL